MRLDIEGSPRVVRLFLVNRDTADRDHHPGAGTHTSPGAHRTPAIIRAVRYILKGHNKLEEEPNGLYHQCDEMNQDVIQELMSQVEATTDVPILPHRSEPFVLEATRRALKRAGYHYDDFVDGG